MKTIRFSQVVERCGKPKPYTLWVDPAGDREFQAALKGHHVMSVHQEAGVSKKDYGQVGYTKDPQANLLVFPKSLQQFEGSRVVGVKYDLLDSASPGKPAKNVAKAQATKTAGAQIENAKPVGRKPGKAKPARVEPQVVKPAEVKTVLPKTNAAQENDAPFAALRLLHLQESEGKANKLKKKEKPDEHPTIDPSEKPPGDYDRIVSHVQQALNELKDGKVILAYQTLEQALRE